MAFYMNGDATVDTDSGVRKNYPNLLEGKTVIAKAAHHGSDSNGSNSSTFLRLFLKPDYVFISAAIIDANATEAGMVEAQHPTLAALNRFKTYTDHVYWSSINGNLTLHCNGQSVTSIGGTGRSITNPYYVDGVLVDANLEKQVTIFESQWYLNYLA
jgi:beta-lactamase superfamily II metal-dependent hydrolase